MVTSKKQQRLSARDIASGQIKRGHPTLPCMKWHDEELPALLQAHGAFGVQFGCKRTGGRWLRNPAVTFFTTNKHAPDPLASGIKPVPKWIAWKDGRRRHRLRTDVVAMPAALELQFGTVFGPGDGVSAGSQVAAIGAVVSRPGAGVMVTTAGHLLGDGQSGLSVDISSGNSFARATAVTSVVSGSIDYALLRPSPTTPCDNLFRDQIRIGPVFTPTLMDVGTPVMVLDRRGQAVRTKCRGVNASFFLGGEFYRGLITTEAVTDGGQSGGALIDDANRLWGFLIGRIGSQASVFVPAQTILDHAGVLLVR